MQHQPVAKWLSLFCQELSCSKSFILALNEQLSKQIASLSGVRTLDNFFLVPPPAGKAAIRYNQINIANVDTDLVGPDNFGYPVTIAWHCETHPDERIDPSQDVSVEKGCRLHVWWEHLPIEALRKDYAHPSLFPPPSFSKTAFSPSEFSFKVEWWPFSWPDVWLELQSIHDLSEEQINQLHTILIDAREQWNAQTLNRGVPQGIVHNLGTGGVKRITANRAEIYIDFGSASPDALLSFLRAIDKVAPTMGLTQGIVRGYPVGSQ